MSLPDAMLEIAEQMEKASAEMTIREGSLLLAGFAREVRIAVRASSPESVGDTPLAEARKQLNDFMRNAASEQARQARSGLSAQESSGSLVEVVGGPAGGDMIEIPPDMPVGAHTVIGGVVYTLNSDRKLEHNDERTVWLSTSYRDVK